MSRGGIRVAIENTNYTALVHLTLVHVYNLSRCMDQTAEIDLINVAFEQAHLPDHDPTR